MAYPPNPNPTPTPTPRPVTPGYVSPADYISLVWTELQDEDQDETVTLHQVTAHFYSVLQVLRSAET